MNKPSVPHINWLAFWAAFTTASALSIVIPLFLVYRVFTPNGLYYALPASPFVMLAVIALFFWEQMRTILQPAEKNAEQNRGLILALSGFSFSALLALAVVDATGSLKLYLSVYYLLLSFLSLFMALNIQGSKNRRWHELFSGTLRDVATLSLILALVSVILKAKVDDSYGYALTGLAVGVWLINYSLSTHMTVRYLKFVQEIAKVNARTSAEQRASVQAALVRQGTKVEQKAERER